MALFLLKDFQGGYYSNRNHTSDYAPLWNFHLCLPCSK